MEERHAPTRPIRMTTGKSFPIRGVLRPILQLSEIIEAHYPCKIQVAEIKNFCHLSRHPTARVNTSVAGKSGYLSIFLYIHIYIGVFSRGCVYFSERATFNNLASLVFCPLALVIWKKDRYPATFCCKLAFMRSPAWHNKWQNFLISAICTSHDP